jgi:hypothetical protein
MQIIGFKSRNDIFVTFNASSISIMIYLTLLLIPLFEQIIIWGMLAALLVYLLILRAKLSKQELFMNSLRDALHKVDPALQPDDIFRFLRKLWTFESGEKKNLDHIFDPSVMEFLFSAEVPSRIFLHYTREKEIAERILREGFCFSDSFHKTAEAIYNDRIDLAYKHNYRKSFGEYALVISISLQTYNNISKRINQRPSYNFLVEHVLSKQIPDGVFLLPNKYLKGYIDISTGEIVTNPDYAPLAEPLM